MCVGCDEEPHGLCDCAGDGTSAVMSDDVVSRQSINTAQARPSPSPHHDTCDVGGVADAFECVRCSAR